MKHIIISLNTGEVVADGEFGSQAFEKDGVYYFDAENVNLSLLVEEKKFKPKKVLGENIKVYSLPDKNMKPTGQVVAWVYEELTGENENLNGKIGLKKATSKEVVVQEFFEE